MLSSREGISFYECLLLTDYQSRLSSCEITMLLRTLRGSSETHCSVQTGRLHGSSLATVHLVLRSFQPAATMFSPQSITCFCKLVNRKDVGYICILLVDLNRTPDHRRQLGPSVLRSSCPSECLEPLRIVGKRRCGLPSSRGHQVTCLSILHFQIPSLRSPAHCDCSRLIERIGQATSQVKRWRRGSSHWK